jgi:hypothetical protein
VGGSGALPGADVVTQTPWPGTSPPTEEDLIEIDAERLRTWNLPELIELARELNIPVPEGASREVMLVRIVRCSYP